MSAAKLLDRLQAVRYTGPGRWLARCPAHDDRNPSLSIRELDDGTILLKDFGGCSAAEVVGALGLNTADLFPKAEGERRRRPIHARIPALDALIALDHEAHVVAVIGADVLDHRELQPDVWERLAMAVHRIGDARMAVAPALHKVTR